MMNAFFSADNKNQTAILKRWAWSCFLYFIFFWIGLKACLENIIDISVFHFLFVFFILFLVQILFYRMVKTAYYERWGEPTFIFYEIMVGLSLLVYFMFWADDVARLSMANIAILGALFGIFSVHKRHFVILAAYPVFVFLLIGLLEFWRGVNVVSVETFFFQLAIISFVLIFFTYIASHISTMRRNLAINRDLLRQQTRALESTNIELQKSLDKMSEMAVMDALTGLYNRHQFVETFKVQTKITAEKGQALGLLIMDVDHFKDVNDKHGHAAGDMILKSFKHLPLKVLRKADFMARYGGEEFVVLLPNTDEQTMLDVAERIRLYIKAMRFDEIDAQYGITISIGCALYQYDEALDDMMSRADKALYKAKTDGRDRVAYRP